MNPSHKRVVVTTRHDATLVDVARIATTVYDLTDYYIDDYWWSIGPEDDADLRTWTVIFVPRGADVELDEFIDALGDDQDDVPLDPAHALNAIGEAIGLADDLAHTLRLLRTLVDADI